ncbi:MAG: hypothetical protein QG620_218 [Patescibacteria group bacterium]|nr:hypothetical protein [Patescibacteria group bacterium]
MEENFSHGMGSEEYKDESSRLDVSNLGLQNMKKENNQTDYIAEGLPVETPGDNNGNPQGIVSVICAGISLVFIPLLFGVLGIIMGAIAKDRGARTLGLAGMVLSAIFMVIGLGLSLYLNFRDNAAVGYMGHLFVNSLN